MSDSLLRTTQARLADKKEIEAAKLRESHGVTFVVPPESYKVSERVGGMIMVQQVEFLLFASFITM